MRFTGSTLRRINVLLLLSLWQASSVLAASDDDIAAEAPRIAAALEQGLAAERGTGLRSDPGLAVSLYCDAGTMGSSEGYFRLGRILADGPQYLRNPSLANAYFALAARLGHRAAFEALDKAVPLVALEESCGSFVKGLEERRFDVDAYISGMSPGRRRIAELVRKHALRNDVDARVALGVALAESNLNAKAVSPQNAQGVMQLIPATQERFGVVDPFDPEANIRGGIAYLKWLKQRFNGDWGLVAAAYNAGEGAVDLHGGIPPYRETMDYVRRVLYFAGFLASSRPGTH